jgi:ribonucleoside-diphosphate reductase alpha chain
LIVFSNFPNIGEFENTSVDVWNGKEFSNTIIKYTGDSILYNITLSNGMSLKCTPQHKWFIRTGNQLHPENCKREIIFTENLKLGDVIYKYDLPLIDMKDIDEFKNPYIHGFFCGDGTYCNNYPMIYLYDKKKELINYFEIPDNKISINKNSYRFYITNKINVLHC